MTNRFFAVGENKTRYDAEIHYTKFIRFIPKMMALFMLGVFRRQVQETLDRFKSFARRGRNGKEVEYSREKCSASFPSRAWEQDAHCCLTEALSNCNLPEKFVYSFVLEQNLTG